VINIPSSFSFEFTPFIERLARTSTLVYPGKLPVAASSASKTHAFSESYLQG